MSKFRLSLKGVQIWMRFRVGLGRFLKILFGYQKVHKYRGLGLQSLVKISFSVLYSIMQKQK